MPSQAKTPSKAPPELRDGDTCDVVAGTHAGKSGIVRDIKTSKTGHVTITVVQANGVRFKTLAKSVVLSSTQGRARPKSYDEAALVFRMTDPTPAKRVFFHGTRAVMKPGDLLQPGYSSNYTERRSPWIYFSETLNAATWGAELAKGDGPGRIYEVDPTGEFVDDPNLTNQRFRGNPTKSYRSQQPLRVLREVLDWTGHTPEEIQAMKDGIAGKEPIDD